MKIKKSKRNSTNKLNKFPLYLYKICKINFNCHQTDQLINANIKKKKNKEKEELKLETLFNIYAKYKNGQKKLSLSMSA